MGMLGLRGVGLEGSTTEMEKSLKPEVKPVTPMSQMPPAAFGMVRLCTRGGALVEE